MISQLSFFIRYAIIIQLAANFPILTIIHRMGKLVYIVTYFPAIFQQENLLSISRCFPGSTIIE